MNKKENQISITSIDLLRISIAIVFILHAIFRIYYATIPQFAEFLKTKSLPFAEIVVRGITIYEIIGGALLLFGFYTKWLSLGFIFILLMGIILIHASLGWFVGEHGTGGVEYSFILIMSLIAIFFNSEKKLKN